MYILLLFLIFIGVIGLTYFVGSKLSPTTTSEFKLERLFSNIFIGTVFIVLLYAFLKSGLTSIYIVTILPLALFFYSKYKKNPPIKINSKNPDIFGLKELLIILCLGLISFGYWALYTIDFSDLSLKVLFYDIHIYSEIARGLINGGIESFHVRFYPLYIPNGTDLYHFFDLWFVAFLSSITGVNTFDILVTVVYPFFYFLTLLGIASFIEKRTAKFWLLVLLPFLITVVLKVDLSPIFKPVEREYAWILAPTFHMELKILCTYPFLLYALHSFINKEPSKAIITLLILAAAYNTLLVAIVPAVFVVAVYQFFTTKDKIGIISIICFALGVVVYDHFFVSKEQLYLSETKFDFPSIKLIIVFFIEYVVKNLMTYIPVVFALLLVLLKLKSNYIKENVNFFIFIVISFLSALVFASIFRGHDYQQAIYNFLPSAMLALFMLALLKLKINAKTILFFIGILGFNIYAISVRGAVSNPKVYASEYINKCNNEFNKSESSSFLIYQQNKFRWSYIYNDLGPFSSRLKHIPSGINIAIDFDTLKQNKNLSPYGNWCVANNLKPNTNSLLQYMAQNKINYMFVSSKDEYPFDVKNNFSIIATDSINNEVLLKRKIID